MYVIFTRFHNDIAQQLSTLSRWSWEITDMLLSLHISSSLIAGQAWRGAAPIDGGRHAYVSWHRYLRSFILQE